MRFRHNQSDRRSSVLSILFSLEADSQYLIIILHVVFIMALYITAVNMTYITCCIHNGII